MKTTLAIVHILLCLVLMAVVLMQHRKQGGFGGIFGGGSQADMGSNQWQRFTGLTKITVVVTTLFMVTSVALVIL
ncbi:preprotein translocase subunit SecG [Dethiosulfovibrio sp. F2B]|uniref:preprotein translocase subunit SecG n=1 Tax=Dethiosulfovibrio faecalis TaxID=2720018 RepID=UPI001F1D6F59|nr:preprotein translocase subunit SecG [Dethiosulfovibrio faecalis]MCF4152680.1 preprotein translocase subunit SecG [Dethiosulfovibrio faecalis]